MRFISTLAVGVAVLVLSAVSLHGQTLASPDGLWQSLDVAAAAAPAAGEWSGVQSYRLASLNRTALQNALATAPAEAAVRASMSPAVITIPMPDGTFQHFQYVESPVMAPELAAQYSKFHTYVGQGIEDPAATVRFDWTINGFHALVLSPAGSVIVDPYVRGQTDQYISFYSRDVSPESAAWTCLTADPDWPHAAPDGIHALSASSGSELMTYRVAVASTAEYTAVNGGATQTLAAIVTMINRITGVFEQEFCIRLQLVANNNVLIYTNAATDPYTNGDNGTMMSENQANLDSVIGSANYDIGHVLGTQGGSGASGVSYVGIVCKSGDKAEGASSTSGTASDWFTMRIVIHEMGHQFGSHHTWNGTHDGCSPDQWGSQTAVEPGSGSTIMAYPGSCGVDDIQSSSDYYFSTKSYEKIRQYCTTGSGSSCRTLSATGNHAPSLTVPAAYTIPKLTPFTLTATGSDPDGDPITYCWEEVDLGPQQALADADNGSSPIFRSWPATTDPSRTFPRLSNLLAGTLPLGEQLPNTDRTLVMRCTARDNRAGGGGVRNEETTLTVTTSAGPFTVTSPNTAVTWSGTKTVTWNVANTNAAPVNCSQVNIRLSINGGNTFPYLLAANTPNDGSQSVTLPSVATTQARIKIEAVNNVFFDISNVDFTIPCGTPPVATDVTASDGAYPYIFVSWTLVSDPYGLSHCQVWRHTSNNSAGATLILDNWTTNGYQDETATPGVTYYYWIKQVNLCGGVSAFSASDSGWCYTGPPTNVAATDGTLEGAVHIIWSAPSGATHYRVYRNTTNNSSTATAISSWQTPQAYNDLTVTPGATYYYWVKAATSSSGAGASDFSTSDSGWAGLSAPASVTASDGTYTDKVEVTAAAVSGANYYQLYHSPSSDPATATTYGSWQTSPTFNDISVIAGRIYYFWVKAAVGSSGERAGPLSAADTGWRKLSPPANVAATDGTDETRVYITWDSVVGATYYRVYRNTTDNFATATALGSWQSSSSYSDYADYGVTYFYWVVAAVDSSGTRPSDPSASDLGWRGVPLPSNLAASDGTYTAYVRLTWDVGAGGLWYRVYRGTSVNPKFSISITNWLNDVTTYNDTGATPGVTYYYWIKTAVDAAGTSATDAVGPNDGWRALTPPTVTASKGTYVDRVELSWPAVPGASHYRVLRNTADNPLTATAISGWLTDLAFTDTTAVEGVGYFYWVIAAIDDSGSRASDFGAGVKGSLARDCDDNGVPDQNDPDADGDRIPDACDQCPNTIPGAQVDLNGCPPLIPADFDRDGDVDLNDLDVLAGCFSGPRIPRTAGCVKADLDSDYDVDQSDFGKFQRCFSGANHVAVATCAQ